MAEETKRNLEPIEESDLNLEEKFTLATSSEKKQEAEISAVEKEVAKEIVAAEKDQAYQQILSDVQSKGDEDDEMVKSDAEVTAAQTDAESQVNNLVDLAMNKSVVHAVKVARHLDDNYVLDSLHDKLLSDELHGALLKKGLIKE